MRALADRHGIRPKRSLGQHFLIDPNLARAIASDAGVGPGDQVVEIGAGLGSLTRALAEAGADVLAVEVDPSLIPALEESAGGLDRVRVLHADATDREWRDELGEATGSSPPTSLQRRDPPRAGHPAERAPGAPARRDGPAGGGGAPGRHGPGEKAYGIPSVRVAYRAEGTLVRRVPPSVFWPRPKVESVIVRLLRRDEPPVDVDEERLWAVVDAGFAERRKTMRNALRRLGVDGEEADALLEAAGVDPSARAETLSLEDFARIAEALPSVAHPSEASST